MKPIWDAEKAAAKEAANRESMLSLAAAAGVKVKQCPTEIRYRPKVSAETVGIGFGAETFFSETETFFFKNFQKFSIFFHVFLLTRGI